MHEMVGVYIAVTHPKDTDGMANSGVPDQTAHFRNSPILDLTVCCILLVPMSRVFMVFIPLMQSALTTFSLRERWK